MYQGHKSHLKWDRVSKIQVTSRGWWWSSFKDTGGTLRGAVLFTTKLKIEAHFTSAIFNKKAMGRDCYYFRKVLLKYPNKIQVMFARCNRKNIRASEVRSSAENTHDKAQ
jgi:hypothetical protein